MRVIITITQKPGVLDPEAQAIATALKNLGYGEVMAVATGKSISLDLDETDPARAQQRAAKMCENLLANTVIEDYSIAIDHSDTTANAKS